MGLATTGLWPSGSPCFAHTASSCSKRIASELPCPAIQQAPCLAGGADRCGHLNTRRRSKPKLSQLPPHVANPRRLYVQFIRAYARKSLLASYPRELPLRQLPRGTDGLLRGLLEVALTFKMCPQLPVTYRAH